MIPKSSRISVSLPELDQKITLIQRNQETLESRCKTVLQILKQRSNLWKKFIDNVQNVKQSVEEVDFMVDLMSVHSHIDYPRLATATENLQVNNLINYLLRVLLTYFSNVMFHRAS